MIDQQEFFEKTKKKMKKKGVRASDSNKRVSLRHCRVYQGRIKASGQHLIRYVSFFVVSIAISCVSLVHFVDCVL